MKTLPSLFLGWMAATAISFPSPTLPQSNSLEAQRAVVVKLRIHRAGQPDETAAGLFVGKDAKNAYFITALHALKVNPKSEELTFVPSVQLQFNSSPQEFEALVFSHFDDGLDLGIVQTAASNLPPGLPQIVRKDVVADIPIHIIGHPPAGSWSVWTGSVQNENTPDGGIQQFITSTSRDNSLVEGYSGGSVFDSSGAFVGMHSKTTTSYGISTKSGDIVAQLKAWHVPTDNLTAPAPPGPAVAPSTTSAEAEIDKVLNAYEAAYSRMDAGALWRIWPSAPADRRSAIQNTFSLARSVSLKLTERQIEIAPDGMSATVTAQSVKDVVTQQGSAPPRLNLRTTLKLEKQKGTWVITAVM